MPVLHHVELVDIEALESVFAERTPAGWVIPEWLTLLRVTADREGAAESIIDAMRAEYQNGEADFADGLRYLRDEASDEELTNEYRKWVKQ